MKQLKRVGRLAGRLYFVLLAGLLAAWGAPAWQVRAGAGVGIVGLTGANALVRFNSATPGTISGPTPITGLQTGEVIVAIDFRPATGELYGLAITNSAGPDTGRLYVIDPATGAATQVGGSPFSTTLADGASYGFDFTPVADRIRVVNSADQNLRVNPDTGGLTGTDLNLDNPAGTEEVVGSAYDRNVDGATATTLFGIDYLNNTLVRQGGINGSPSPNLGGITTIGPLGLTTASRLIGFDIDGAYGTHFVSLQNNGNNLFGLYALNWNTGAATLLGTIGTGTLPIRGLAVFPTWKIFLPYIS
ncbi:MAG: DUF4394 domain-containing protein [Chloroflexi bacterium]|nr:DUF4394 domain-containing protein [Chloroflexota bacterium]